MWCVDECDVVHAEGGVVGEFDVVHDVLHVVCVVYVCVCVRVCVCLCVCCICTLYVYFMCMLYV